MLRRKFDWGGNTILREQCFCDQKLGPPAHALFQQSRRCISGDVYGLLFPCCVFALEGHSRPIVVADRDSLNRSAIYGLSLPAEFGKPR